MLIDKIKYYFYSKPYRKIYTNQEIEKIRSSKYICLSRRNGKTIMTYKLNYISAVENHDFKYAKKLIKGYKKIFCKDIF